MRTERTIRNCVVRMKLACPKTWEALRPTGEPNVRHCTHCDQDVYYCATDAETIAHARAGRCIAREMPHRSARPPVIIGRAAATIEPTAEQEAARRFARREHGIDTLLRGRIEGCSRDCPECGYPVPGFRQSCYVCGFAVGRV
jgi:hypothetical protein